MLLDSGNEDCVPKMEIWRW